MRLSAFGDAVQPDAAVRSPTAIVCPAMMEVESAPESTNPVAWALIVTVNRLLELVTSRTPITAFVEHPFADTSSMNVNRTSVCAFGNTVTTHCELAKIELQAPAVRV